MTEMEINNNVDEIMTKANTLIEALPYIRRFNGATIIVKYGGSAMLDDQLKMNVIKDVALLKLVGMRPIIVHGGGKEISKWVKLSGKEPEFYNGLRVTDKDTMNVAEMVLNKVNKELVGLMQKMGVNAVGLCGKDGNMIRVNKKMPDGKDIGFVGEVSTVNTDLLNTLMDNDFIPVIAPIGLDDEFNAYNINADDAACGVAKAMDAEKLVFLTDIEGVFIDPTNKKTLISEMDIKSAKDLDGKTVAIPQIGNTQHLCLLKLLSDNGLKTVEEGGTVTVTAVENADVQNMMDQGNIDAALVPEPWGSTLVKNGAEIILDYNQVYMEGNYPVAVVVVRNEFLKEHPDLVKDFLRQHEEATDEINQNVDKAAEIINNEINAETGKSLSADILKTAFQKLTISTDVNKDAVDDFAAISLDQKFIDQKPTDDFISVEETNTSAK